jgi:hypothetical protein
VSFAAMAAELAAGLERSLSPLPDNVGNAQSSALVNTQV